MSEKISKEFALHRLSQAKEDLNDAEFSYKNNRFKMANNRSYYAIFHAIRAVLAIEGVDFKRHKDVIGYFCGHYIKTDIFPKKINNKIIQASKTREDSDYDDNFIISAEKTYTQIESAKEIIDLVEKYLNEYKID